MAALGIIVAFAGLGLGPLTDYSSWSLYVLIAGTTMFVFGYVEDRTLSHERHDR